MAFVCVFAYNSFSSHLFAIISFQLYLLVSLYLSPAALATPSSNLLFLMKHIEESILAPSDDNI